MALTVQQIRPVAHLPLVLGVLRRLEVATVIDSLTTPHPAHVLSTGRGVEALVLAILDGDHALYKVGQRLEERGILELLQAGLPRASLHDYRLGHILDALFAPSSIRCIAPSRSKRWRSMSSRPRGSIRTPPRLRSMGPIKTNPRHQGRRGPPTGRAKTGGPTSNRCS